MNLPADMFDWYTGADDEYKDRQRARKHRKDRQERRELTQARKAAKSNLPTL